MLSSIRVAAVAILSAAAVPLLSSAPAAAIGINVGGNYYDITVSTTSYIQDTVIFGRPPSGKMPWWGDDLLASEFAAQAYSSLGAGWDTDYGPIFAHRETLGQVLGITQSISDPLDQIDVAPNSNTIITYAIATSPVPGPLPVFGIATAFSCSRQLKKRIRTQ
jgi:hypothetical protein